MKPKKGPYFVIARIRRKYLKKRPVKRKERAAWECRFCGRREFLSSKTFQLHVLTHNLNMDPMSNCEFCGRPFFTKSQLMKHMKSLHCGVMPVYCSICPTSFATRSLAIIHERQHNLQPLMTSSVVANTERCPAVRCRKRVDSPRLLIEHVTESHSLPKGFASNVDPRNIRNVTLFNGNLKAPQLNIFQCTEGCGQFFPTPHQLQEHVQGMCLSNDFPYHCEQCGKRFKTGSGFSCHMKTHTARKYYNCYLCHEELASLVEMKTHPKEKHWNEARKKFLCPQCGKEFESFGKIKQHCRYLHSSYRCTVCGKTFCRSDKLRLHLSSHSNFKEWSCSFCGKNYKRKDKLNEHVKKFHSNGEPSKGLKSLVDVLGKKDAVERNLECYTFRCMDCKVGFKRRGMLVNHMVEKHPKKALGEIPELRLPLLRTQKKYQCLYCDKVYRSASKRKKHILTHHPGSRLPRSAREEDGEEKVEEVSHWAHDPFRCNVESCNREYATRSLLIVHLKNAHQISNLSKIHVEASLEGNIGNSQILKLSEETRIEGRQSTIRIEDETVQEVIRSQYPGQGKMQQVRVETDSSCSQSNKSQIIPIASVIGGETSSSTFSNPSDFFRLCFSSTQSRRSSD